MLRVFTFPIPTVAAITGHAIAGGAMLAFACDLRHVADGRSRPPERGRDRLALPSWAIALARSAVPTRWHTEAILHARAYTPGERSSAASSTRCRVPPSGSGTTRAPPRKRSPASIAAYAVSKARHRARAVDWAQGLLEKETGRLPARATVG
jgi:enoyl-CoA hydratase